MQMMRGYYVGDDYDTGIAVVATSAKEAKKIAYKELRSDYEWIDIKVDWIKEADVTGLPVGIVEDARVALVRGLYAYIYEDECEECLMDTDLVAYEGRALCSKCVDRIEGSK